MLHQRLRTFIHVLSGKVFHGRNTYNSKGLWKRGIVFLPWYILGIIFAILDLFFVGYLAQGIMQLTQRNGRKLSPKELELFSNLTEDATYLKSVRVYEKSWVARFGAWLTRRNTLGLGIANTVHFNREINPEENASDRRWLVHEVAHTLQFKYRGLIYIPEALIAQHFSGYGFGGKSTLMHAKLLRSFNPEQQAEIFVAMQLSAFSSALRDEIHKGKW